ncbi:MAG: hypothetical protein GTO60_16810 [Gammaproteobacteria bacterium]|nr:hypothetical protein [Gammaproteobacteria bacterium]
MVRVILPYQLQVLANTGPEVELEINGNVTIASVLDALEGRFPMLQGAIIDHHTRKRRPLIRFFACSEDFSHVPLDTALPVSVISGEEALLIVGAISGG